MAQAVILLKRWISWSSGTRNLFVQGKEVTKKDVINRAGMVNTSERDFEMVVLKATSSANPDYGNELG